MKKPIKSCQPAKPEKPTEFVVKQCDGHISLYNNETYTLQSIIDQMCSSLSCSRDDIDLSKVKISIDFSAYGDNYGDNYEENNSCVTHEAMPLQTRNSKYKKELAKYDKDMIKYEAALQKFEIENAQYVLAKKEYDKWIAEQDIARAKAVLKKYNILVQ